MGGEGHGDSFGRSSGFIEERSVRHGKPSQLHDHSLIVEEHLETALRDLRLVGRVRRVPLRVFEDVSLDDGRNNRGVVALALVAFVDFIYTGKLIHFLQCLTLTVEADHGLPTMLEGSARVRSNRVRHRLVYELINGLKLEVIEDVLSLFSVVANMPVYLPCNYTKDR